MPGLQECVYVVDTDEEARNRVVARVAGLGVPCMGLASNASLLEDPRVATGCIISEWALADTSGEQIVASLGQIGLPVIIVSSRGTVRDAVRAIKAGAFDFLEKPGDMDLLESVRLAIAESRRSAQHDGTRRALLRHLDALSSKEREVLLLAAAGYTSKAIASRLHVTKRTVDSHRHHINHKLGLHTREDLLPYAGLILRSEISEVLLPRRKLAESERLRNGVRCIAHHRRKAR